MKISFGSQKPACREDIWNSAIVRDIPKGKPLCREGDDRENLPMVISGSLRVFKSAENDREVTLYPVSPGSCCVLSAAWDT